MKLKFLGSGSHGTLTNYQSNMVLSVNGKNLLIDCGTDIRRSLNGCFKAREIDAVYISHLHTDHMGGLEWFAFNTYFDPTRWSDGKYVYKPKLYVEESMLDSLWDCLRGNLRTVQNIKALSLYDYFDVETFRTFGNFNWNGTMFATVALPHVSGLSRTEYSHGLTFITPSLQTAFITTDTQFVPEYAERWYNNSQVIFHEVETTKFKSNVHAHYSDLTTLTSAVKSKMWLYHFSDDNPYFDQVEADGFKGFVSRGQVFTL